MQRDKVLGASASQTVAVPAGESAQSLQLQVRRRRDGAEPGNTLRTLHLVAERR